MERNLLPGLMKFSVIFLITERCNLRCPYCFLDDRRGGASVPLDKFKAVIRKHRPLYLQLTGGEPTAHPEFEPLVRWCARRPMATQMTINGRGALKRIRFFEDLKIKPIAALSLDAAGPEHDRIRNRAGLFDEIMETFKFLKSIRAPAGISAVIFGPDQVPSYPRGNIDQIGPLIKLAERLRVPIGIQPMNPAPLETRRALARELTRLRSPRVAGSPAFIRMLDDPAPPGPCNYNRTHISYDADANPLPTRPGGCYFLDNCDKCFYACVREPSVVFHGALPESALHFARMAVMNFVNAL